ncbi:MAG: hypothetical protein DRH37_00680 [Deltaproteobacteria bacterium]|nr:MAG: hypothetical protein DRH37_00680 [Deltaproteobacteria bacterium]
MLMSDSGWMFRGVRISFEDLQTRTIAFEFCSRTGRSACFRRLPMSGRTAGQAWKPSGRTE